MALMYQEDESIDKDWGEEVTPANSGRQLDENKLLDLEQDMTEKSKNTTSSI